jgi:2-oxoglutarate ferredoxin oxidoreductase subunit alpha
MGLVAGAQLAGLPMFFGGYPITPASAILHHLSRLKEYHVTTFQAEDEIAAISARDRRELRRAPRRDLVVRAPASR